MSFVAIALGSNLGDRQAHLTHAVNRLHILLENVRISEFLETAPFDVPDHQPAYLNAAVVGETTLDPEALLAELQAIERERGRERPSFRAARTLDVDLILYGDRIIHGPGLEIPHPRFRERDFVLAPLSEIAGGLIDPVTGLTVAALLAKLTTQN